MSEKKTSALPEEAGEKQYLIFILKLLHGAKLHQSHAAQTLHALTEAKHVLPVSTEHIGTSIGNHSPWINVIQEI